MFDTHDFDPRYAKQEWRKYKQRAAITRKSSSEFSISRNAEIDVPKERREPPYEFKRITRSDPRVPVPSR